MQELKVVLPIAVAISLGACASKQTTTQSEAGATSTAPSVATPQKVKSRDGSFEGEVYGQPVAGSKFSKLSIGMQMSQVQDVMDRAPDRSHSYESGKRWIPFYFGNDARRIQALYKGEGCLIFTGGNVWGGGAGDLIAIYHDASGDCYQP